MQKLVFTNGGGQSIDLTSGNFGITNWEGLSNTELNIQVQQVPFQDGGVFLDALMEQREISVTVAIQDNNDLSLRYELKRQLISALNPKLGEGVLVYTNDYLSRQIKAIPQLPIFENKNSNDAGTLKASVVFSCPSPYWEDLEETSITFKQAQTIVNNGDVPCQIKAKLNINSKNPMLYNKTNQKEISINGTFSNNVFIDTNIGQKKIEAEELGFKWECGGTFNACCYGQEKNIYVGDTIVVEDILLGKMYSTELGYESTLYGICYSKTLGLFVVVGARESILTSVDGNTWELRHSGLVGNNLMSICYSESNNIFVAVGYNGLIYTSTNGTEWTLQTSGTSGIINSVIFGNNLFIAVGASGLIITSPDGITWTSQTSGSDKYLTGVVYSDVLGMYVTVGQQGAVLTSINGIAWTNRGVNTSYALQKISYGNEVFVAVGVTSSMALIITSSDGINWTSQTSDITSRLQDVRFSSRTEEFIVCGYYGAILTSSDGINWDSKTSGSRETLYGFTYSETLNLFVAVGANGSIITSPDGKIWTRRTSGVSVILQNLVYSESLQLFVLVGNSGTILTSNDGITWTSRTSGTSENLRCVTFANNIFVIGGNNGILLTSSDGITWTSRTSDVDVLLSGINYGFGLFIAVGNNGTIITSSDGITWTSRTSGTTRQLSGVVYSETQKMFVVVGGSGTILTSKDGINWVNRTMSVNSLRNVIYSEKYGIFIAVGASETIVSSSNGIDWNIINYVSTQNTVFQAIAESQDLIVIVGDSSYILNSYISDIENIISLLTPQSDMTFNLEKGENEILFLSENNSNCTLSYRQKYIGV